MIRKGLLSLSVLLLLLLAACKQQPSLEVPSIEPPMLTSKLDTLLIPRPFMGDTAQALVLLPEAYLAYPDSSFPVVYLLHGYSGNQNNWTQKAPELPYWASLFGQIIVMPDGAYNSWYIDSPIKPEQTFATHIGQTLPALIDQLYRTQANPQGRAITGLSMGGHGAMYLATQFPDQFGAVSSMSGGLDLRPFPNNWDLKDILGDPAAFAKNWDNYSVINQVETFQGRNVPILIDCGSEDFFFEVNQATHEKLKELGIAHEYFIRPGAHNWDYWTKILPYHLLFFDQFFQQ